MNDNKNLKALCAAHGLKVDEITHRDSSVHKKKLAKKGHYWLEIVYKKRVYKAIEVPSEISEEQKEALVNFTRGEIRELGL